MFLKSLLLRNFRNFTDQKITFSPRCNLIYGENAQGKTNLLEAIYFLSTGRSFRTARLNEAIQKGKSFFYLEAEVVKDGILQTLKVHFDGKTKRFQYNSTLYHSFTSLLGIFPSILHAPEDIELITGSPLLRRRALNIHLAQEDPLYVRHLSRYTKALKQRNVLLRSPSKASLECWDEELSTSAAYLTYARNQMIEELLPAFRRYYEEISGKKEKALFSYLPSLPLKNSLSEIKTHYLELLLKNRKKELEYKTTLFGPHKDDLYFQIDALAAKDFASEGQKRSLSCAFRLSEWERLSKNTEDALPICIDDFGTQLDPSRKTKLQNTLSHFIQVFFTLPEKISFKEKLSSYFKIAEGEVVKEESIIPQERIERLSPKESSLFLK